MNKMRTFLLPAIYITLIFTVPTTSHAAFNFTKTWETDGSNTYTSTLIPLYAETSGSDDNAIWNWDWNELQLGTNITFPHLYATTTAIDNDPAVACAKAAQNAGLSDLSLIRCVYSKYKISFHVTQSSSYCDVCGGGGVGVGGAEFSGTPFVKEVRLYQTPIVKQNLAVVSSTINQYMDDTFNFYFWWIGGGPPSRPYYDACAGSTSILRQYYGLGVLFFPPDYVNFSQTYCYEYDNTGLPPLPVATLSAAPASIISGGSSLLTWSCSNSSTSAVIDNGVGAVSPASGGSIAVMPASTTTYKVTCTNAAGSSSANATVTVTASPADLIAVTGSPTAATAGVSQTYTGTVTNSGSSSTGAGFTTILQICDAGCTTYNNRTTVATVALAASASTGVSKADTIATSGTYFYRFCADNDTSWLGTIPESDETNNCGGWSSITVSSGVGAISSCTVSNPSPSTGMPVIYTATLSGSASAPFVWTPSLPSACTGGSGSTNTCTFPSNGAYTMQVSAVNASAVSCTPAFVNVGCAAGALPTITANPSRVKPGSTSTITWTASPSINTSCVLTGPGINQTYNATSCVVTPTPVVTPPITTQSVYTIVCDGVAKAQAIVNVVPKIIEI